MEGQTIDTPEMLAALSSIKASESQALIWFNSQIRDGDWLLVCAVKNGVIGIFLMGECSWEIREC